MAAHRKTLLGAAAVAALVSAVPASAASMLPGLDSAEFVAGVAASAESDLAALEAIEWNLSMQVSENRGYRFGSGQAVSFEPLEDPLAVPEPSAWLMFIAGFGAVGRAMRRYRPGRSTSSSV